MSLGSHGVIKVTKKLLKMADKEPSDIDEVLPRSFVVVNFVFGKSQN